MSYSKSYPVLFESGGDTVRDAFSKHIQEFEAVYGILNELADKDLSDEELSVLKTGDIEMSRVKGYMDGSRITGVLSGATIPGGNVTGLLEEIAKILPKASGDGITESSFASPGYVKFANGIIVQWGNSGAVFGESAEALFFYPFMFIKVLAVQLTCQETAPGSAANVQLLEYGEAGIKCRLTSGVSSTASVNYLAIGYGGK